MNIDFDVMREPDFFNRTEKAREEGIKKVDWEDVPFCPICGYLEIEGYKFAPSINFAICSNCNCLYSTQVPVKSNSAEYDLKDISEVSKIPDENKRDYRQQRFAMERIGLIRQYLNKPLSKANLLDIGCNTGFFLEVASDYFNISNGTEHGDVIREYAHEKLKGKCVVSKDIDDAEQYDVITLFDVIEHIKDPLKLLYRIKEILSDDGIIVIFTPNWKSLAFDLLGKEGCQYFPADHLLFLCLKVVKEIARKLDMFLEMYETRGMDWFDILAFERDINKINIKDSMLKKQVNKLQEQVDKNNYANHMRFVLRK